MTRKLLLFLCLAACGPVAGIGHPPDFTAPETTIDATAIITGGLPLQLQPPAQPDATAMASLWTGADGSLFADRRAARRGDILTVVIEIDDSAQINNSSDRARESRQDLDMPQLFGLPQELLGIMPDGASVDPAVDIASASEFNGEGSIARNEQLELLIAATVVDVLPNGVLAISGNQEVRVNNELRELLVTGYVRPGDISRQNTITYDKIASARISYGGRGIISDMQEPRYGQQLAEFIAPF